MSQTSPFFRIRLPVWARRSHPVFHQEAQRHVTNRGIAVLQLVFLPIVLAVTSLALFGSLVITLPLLLGTVDGVIIGALSVTLGILATIQLAAGALGNVMVITQVSPVISGEIELQSWRLLRTTTLTLHEIVFAKFSAALLHLRLMLGGLMTLRIITTVTAVMLFLYSMLRVTVYEKGPDQALMFFLQFEWLPFMVPLVAVLIAYLFQPVIQYFMNGAIALLASSYTRSRGQSIAAALMARLALWVFALLLHIAAITSLSGMLENWSHPGFSSTESLRALPSPSPEAVTWVTCLVVGGYAISIIAGQLGIALASTGLALRRTRHLGV